MAKTWQEQLFQDFPYLYRSRKYSLRRSLMGFGFECGKGWVYVSCNEHAKEGDKDAEEENV